MLKSDGFQSKKSTAAKTERQQAYRFEKNAKMYIFPKTLSQIPDQLNPLCCGVQPVKDLKLLDKHSFVSYFGVGHIETAITAGFLLLQLCKI